MPNPKVIYKNILDSENSHEVKLTNELVNTGMATGFNIVHFLVKWSNEFDFPARIFIFMAL